jgi:hypothetical protein
MGVLNIHLIVSEAMQSELCVWNYVRCYTYLPMCVWVEAEGWVWKLKNWVFQYGSDHSPALEANHSECHLTL